MTAVKQNPFGAANGPRLGMGLRRLIIFTYTHFLNTMIAVHKTSKKKLPTDEKCNFDGLPQCSTKRRDYYLLGGETSKKRLFCDVINVGCNEE